MESAEEAWPGTGIWAGQSTGDSRVGVRPGWLEEVPLEMCLEGRDTRYCGQVLSPSHPAREQPSWPLSSCLPQETRFYLILHGLFLLH